MPENQEKQRFETLKDSNRPDYQSARSLSSASENGPVGVHLTKTSEEEKLSGLLSDGSGAAMSTIPDAEWKESKTRKSDKRVLDDLIQNYEKKQKEKKDKKVVDGHVLDDYISVLSYLHKT